MSKKSKIIAAVAAVVVVVLVGLGGFFLGKAQTSQVAPSDEGLETRKGTPVSVEMANQFEEMPPILNPMNDELNEISKGDSDFFHKALLDYSERPCGTFTEGAYHQYLRAKNSDGTQYLIGHGCGANGFVNSIFIKQEDGKWLKVGAPEFKFNNQDDEAKFDNALDVPTCETAQKYNFSNEVAPVCYDAESGRYAINN